MLNSNNCNNMIFFYGTQDEYNKLSDLDKKYYFYLIEEDSNDENGELVTYLHLYLGDLLIFSSNKEKEYENAILNALKEAQDQFILTNPKKTQRISGQDLIIEKNLTVEGNIFANNLKYEDGLLKGDKFFVNELSVGGTEASPENANLYADNESVIIKNLNAGYDSGYVRLNNVKDLFFSSEANEIKENFPTIIKEVFDDEGNSTILFQMNSSTGELIVNKLIINDTLSYGESAQLNQDNIKTNKLQIGNIILEDDGYGNLKITSISSEV